MVQDDETRQVFEDVLLRQDGLLTTPAEKLETYVSTVAAALAITGKDIEQVRNHVGLPSNAPLDLSTLSTLSRYATLAKALGIRVRNLITLLRWIPASINPFLPGDPRPALQFVRTVRKVEASAFPIPLLNYLFRDEAEATRHPAPTRTLVETTLRTLQGGLEAIYQELIVTEPPADFLRTKLEVAGTELGLVGQGIEQALAVLDPRQTVFQGQTITLDARKKYVGDHFKSFMSDPANALFSAALPNSANLEEGEKRFLENIGTVLAALLPWLRKKLRVTLVVDTMADAMGVEERIMRLLLEDLLKSTDPQQPGTALDYLLGLVDEKGTAVDMTLDAVPAKPPTLMIFRIFKAAALVTGFEMTDTELSLFTGPESPLLTFDPSTPLELNLNKLPISGIVPISDPLPGQLFAVWGALRAYYELRGSLPRSEKTLADYFRADATNKSEILQEVAGWDAKQIAAVVQEIGQPNPPVDLPALIRLERAMALLKRVGATPDRMFAWAGETLDHVQADEIVQTVKSRYERPRWLEVARGLNDPLREKQRDALVALLLVRLASGVPIGEWPHPVLELGANGEAVKELQQKLNAAQTGAPLIVDGKFGPQTRAAVVQFQKTFGLAIDGIVGPATWGALDALVIGPRASNDLLQYFLIDVEMSSCMLTSRIKQAISSVQLFVQRCLLNLEPAVSPAEIDPDRWEWMKHYRIWEANRKVFLYPETYILPELRDDKTPFFRELETELLQNELTGETIEKAFRNYLYKLDEVARLDIRAFCKEDEDEIYHVFGRTWNPPYVYYYRRGAFTRSGDPGEWTPWERVDLDIPSDPRTSADHLIPVVSDGRLYLLWLVLNEKPKPSDLQAASEDDSEDDSNGSAEPPTPVVFAIGLAYSEYQDGCWSRKQVSAETILSLDPLDGAIGSLLFTFGGATITARAASSSYERVVTVYGENRLQFAISEFDRRLDAIGSFKLTNCPKSGAVLADDTDVTNAKAHGISWVQVDGMRWRSRPGIGKLVFSVGGPTTVLGTVGEMEQPFSVQPEPERDALSWMRWRAFVYQDRSSAYFARPVTELVGPFLLALGEAGIDAVLNDTASLQYGDSDVTWSSDPVVGLAGVAGNVGL